MKKHNNSEYTNDRLAQQINKQLALILVREVRDPRVGMVTITDVKITRDLSIVKVYITSLGVDLDDKAKQATKKPESATSVLNAMAGFLRTELASRIKMRSMPELRFYHDETIQSGNRIEELLDQVKKES